MKKVSRLLGFKSKKTHGASKYNEIVDGVSTRNASNRIVVPPVHNYGKTQTKTKLNLKSKVKQLQRHSNSNTINYSSLERKRNDHDNVNDVQRMKLQHRQQVQRQKNRRKFFSKRCRYKWQRFFNCFNCINCCQTKRTYKPSAMMQCGSRNGGVGVGVDVGIGNGNADGNTSHQKPFKRLVCCHWNWQDWRICGNNGNYHYNSTEEDDDIDGKVAAFLMEMKQRESTSAVVVDAPKAQNQSTQLYSKILNESCTKLIPTTAPLMGSCEQYVGEATNAFAFRRRSQSQSRPQRRAWTWDDSLRSNSDRFLETLEEDDPGIWGLKSKTGHARRPTLQIVCVVGANNDSTQKNVGRSGNREEAKAAAEELNRSPVIGQRNNDPTSSPLQSRGSVSSDAWPAQSDEDIDRLVAMHQNRSSLSSLGLRSDSMASVYSGAGEGRYGTVVVKGQVEFGMQYNYKLGALEIHVVRCKDLAAVDAKRNRSDPYVKVYLLPDKSKAGKRKTKVKKHTLNPIFDEILRFHVPISSLETRTLWLTVWHSDMFGRNDFLGEVNVNLQGRVFDNPQSQWYLLQERSEPFDEVATYRGDIVVGLKYIPPDSSNKSPGGFLRHASVSSNSGSSSNLRKFGSIKSVSSKSDRSAKGGQLHVLVKEAKHLSPIKANGTCDAFCKSYLLPDRTRSSKQKTPVVKRSQHPSWNYTFVYEDVSLEDLSERALELTVWDHDRLASNEFLGGIRFSLGTGKSYGRHVDWMDASGKELSLWQNMLDRPNFWVEGSLPLRSTLDGIRAIP